jgi:hypothetical protein
MSSQRKRRFRKIRSEFKVDLYSTMNNNRAFAMMVISTYKASMHRKHIRKMWALLGNHPDARKEYGDKLFGKMLTGEDSIMTAIHFADKNMYLKYVRKLPECYAMGDALSVAYQVLNN